VRKSSVGNAEIVSTPDLPSRRFFHVSSNVFPSGVTAPRPVMTCDAHHMTAPLPDGDGAARAMKLALKDAGVNPDEVDYINSHGTSTGLGDIAEIKALKTVFGEYAYKLAVNSTKSMVGHLLGAAGGVETAVTAMSIKEQMVHPTLNLDNADEECDLDFVTEGKREMNIRNAINNSFGFGGHNVSIVLARHE